MGNYQCNVRVSNEEDKGIIKEIARRLMEGAQFREKIGRFLNGDVPLTGERLNERIEVIEDLLGIYSIDVADNSKYTPDSDSVSCLPKKGYKWKAGRGLEIFIKNGSIIGVRDSERKFSYYACVASGDLMYKGKSWSPEGFLNYVFPGSFDPLLALWIREPGETDWSLSKLMVKRVSGPATSVPQYTGTHAGYPGAFPQP